MSVSSGEKYALIIKQIPRRKLSEKNIRKLTRSGGGKCLGLTLPIEIVKELKWREKQKVVVRRKGKEIIIKDWKK